MKDKLYSGNFHIEQDTDWESEQCLITGRWSKTKKVLAKTWSLYERVKPFSNESSYDTFRKQFPNKKEALNFLHNNCDSLKKGLDN